jgi:glycosyltransferase involved in cell wall biosynthesis
LKALQQQTRPADEVLVVVRDTDAESWAFLEAFHPNGLPLRAVTVRVTGVIAAMNTGLEAAQGDIIAFTDDDAAPHPDWLERIEALFLSDSRAGAVGGRDFVYYRGQLVEGASEVVGRVQWFGRVIGNHHIGVGEAREVDVLKGVSMSFRRSAIAGRHFDERMRGTGAQVHFEMAFTLALQRTGWKIIYDPRIAVDHFRGQRFDEDQREDKFNDISFINKVHNETLVLLEHLPFMRRVVFLIWSVVIGTREAPGFVQWLRFLPHEGLLAGQKFLATLRGRWQGWQTWRQCVRKASTEAIALVKTQQTDLT